MTVVVSSKSELVVPRSVRRRAGLKSGQEVEFKVSGGVINIVPKLPSAADEYTPAQRRVIDARLAKAEADIKAGRISPAFSNHQEFTAALHEAATKPGPRKTKRSARPR